MNLFLHLGSKGNSPLGAQCQSVIGDVGDKVAVTDVCIETFLAGYAAWAIVLRL